MSALFGRRRVVAAIILVLVAVVATESVVLAVTTVRQGSVEYMKVATATDFVQTQSTLWTDVPATALALTIPSGEHDFLQITFSTNAPNCNRWDSEAGSSVCFLRAMVDGQVVSPGQVQFGRSDLNPMMFPATMQWVSAVLAPGTHYVKIQFQVGGQGNALGLNGRTTNVVRVKAY